MTATSRAADDRPTASDAAASLRGAPLARLLVRTDGDGVAAAGVLARALRDVGVPVQVSPTATRAERGRRAAAGDPDAVTVAIGAVDDAAIVDADESDDADGSDDVDDASRPDVTLDGDEPASVRAAEVVAALDADLAAPLALAGVVAAGETPEDATPEVLETASERGIERRPGVGLATDDLAAGLAGATLFHAPFSGDADAAADALADVGIDSPESTGDDEARRTVASLVALAATDGPAPERAATTVERALRPLAWDGPAPTIEGYADALDVAATVEPAVALAHALGDGGFDAVRDVWREHGPAVHDALGAAEPARYDGVAVVDAGDAPAPLVARLARDASSPEPVAVALGTDEVGVATVEREAIDLTEAVADAIGGAGDAAPRRGVVREPDDVGESTIVDAIRDARGEGSP